VIRERDERGPKTLHADEVYYDVNRNVAVAIRADLAVTQRGIPEPLHLTARELDKESLDHYHGYQAEVFSSRLPSDPGVKVYLDEATLDQVKVPKRSVFGRPVIDPKTGQPEIEDQQLVHGDNVFLKLEDVPIFYLPFVQGDANDPLGPIEEISVGYNSNVFGARVDTRLNLYDLLGITPLPKTRWDLDLDYLSLRGPGGGTRFQYGGNNIHGIPANYQGDFQAWGIYDTGTDKLGGPRTGEPHPDARGRLTWQNNVQDLPYGFVVQWQLGLFSDKNFYEQYFKPEFDNGIEQHTWLYVKQQQNNWAWFALAEYRTVDWYSQTESLPRVDGYLIGQSFFDLFTYNARGSLGYYQLRPTNQPPPPFPTDVTTRYDNTGRFDLAQTLSLPFYAGPVKLVPYATLDLTEYTNDLENQEVGRVYGGGGVLASIPFTRLYPDIKSCLLNLDGINHKIVASANYFYAGDNVPYTRLPQLDRLNDDATDFALRGIRPLEPFYNPANGLALEFSPKYDPQTYAIRRLVETRIDTLASIEELQMDLRQRWQTKRGYPGLEHIVDWMTLDLNATYFPRADHDNFGTPFGFLQYDYLWNIGDRTSFVSTGWVDPFGGGARVFTVGLALNRPDRTSYFLGFREIEPVGSEAVTGAITYIFSPKYAMTASTVYDFGTSQALSNSLVLTRMGTDLQVSLGITYNALQSSFGVIFELAPIGSRPTARLAGLPTYKNVGVGE
jgi:hypothetical protein